MFRTLLPLFAILTSLSGLPAQEGRLERVRQEVDDPTPRSSQPSPPPPSSAGPGEEEWTSTWGDDPEGENFIAVTTFGAVYLVVSAPFTVPRNLIGDDGRRLEFPRHPYERGYPGYLVLPAIASAEVAEAWAEQPPRWWMARVGLENGNDFSGINRFQGQLLVDTASRFGFVTNWDWFRERLDSGRQDNLAIGDLTFTYRFAQSEHAQFRAGVGGRVLTDDGLTRGGINFHYGGEWFVSEPWILTGSVDLGSLGDAFVVRTRATAGIIWHGWEAFAGYDLLRIGCVNLHGPMIGVRWWF